MTPEEKIKAELSEYLDNRNDRYAGLTNTERFLLKKIAELEEKLNAISSQQIMDVGPKRIGHDLNRMNQKPIDASSLINKTPTK